MVSGSKQVSSNSICTNTGELWLIVPGQYRAWTSSDRFFDSKSWTVECANLSTNGWTISRESHEALAQLAAALCVEHGWGRLNRSGSPSTWNVIGHREIYQLFGRSYATSCPGGMDLDWIVRRGNEILDGRDEIDMLSDNDRALISRAIDESRGNSQRLDSINWSRLEKLDKLDKLDSLGSSIKGWIDSAVQVLSRIVEREGRGGRAYRNKETGYIVIISEKGRWIVDVGLDEQAVANLAARGWCQSDILELSASDWAWTLRQYDRIAVSAGPLPATLEAVAYPEGQRKPAAPVNPIIVASPLAAAKRL